MDEAIDCLRIRGFHTHRDAFDKDQTWVNIPQRRRSLLSLFCNDSRLIVILVTFTRVSDPYASEVDLDLLNAAESEQSHELLESQESNRSSGINDDGRCTSTVQLHTSLSVSNLDQPSLARPCDTGEPHRSQDPTTHNPSGTALPPSVSTTITSVDFDSLSANYYGSRLRSACDGSAFLSLSPPYNEQDSSRPNVACTFSEKETLFLMRQFSKSSGQWYVLRGLMCAIPYLLLFVGWIFLILAAISHTVFL